MEYALPKPSSNISDMVSKFAKICRLRSIGVLSTENPNHSHVADADSDASAGKIHPNPPLDLDHISAKTTSPHAHDSNDESQIPNLLFETLSALNLAYVQLQQAHIPYDPEKITAADEIVVSMLEGLCKIKHSYKEKKVLEAERRSSQSDLLRDQIDDNEKTLEKLKSRLQVKDTEAIHLRQKLEGLEVENRKLVNDIRQKSFEIRKARVLNVTAFEDTFRAASKSIHDFAKPLISLMKASGWDLDLAADAIEHGVSYSRRSHKKYAFEAYIARRMFHGMLLESYNVDDVMRFDDPIDALIENPDSAFAKFCRDKYLLVVHPNMEASFFGNFDQRTFISSGKHPRTPLYQAFARMAKWVWVLHGIGSSIEPKAESFAVGKGSEFSDVYMECVEEDKEREVMPREGQARKVEFMVMPGFRIGETLVRSRVYLSSIESSSGVC